MYHVILHFLPKKQQKKYFSCSKSSKKCVNRDQSQYRDKIACVRASDFRLSPNIQQRPRLCATSATLFENVLLLFPQARCMYFLGQFEKCLLTWTKADRLRKNNKEVFRKRQKILNITVGGTVISMFLSYITFLSDIYSSIYM